MLGKFYAVLLTQKFLVWKSAIRHIFLINLSGRFSEATTFFTNPSEKHNGLGLLKFSEITVLF